MARAATSNFFNIPDSEAEHAVEMIEDIRPPLAIAVQ
jgi:hypothetical protein